MAVDICFDQLGDDVVGRVLSSAGGQLCSVQHHLAGRGQGFGLCEFRVFVADHLVGPVE